MPGKQNCLHSTIFVNMNFLHGYKKIIIKNAGKFMIRDKAKVNLFSVIEINLTLFMNPYSEFMLII